MKTIIAGSRTLTYGNCLMALAQCPWLGDITEVVCGCAEGIDRAGEYWARNTVSRPPVTFFPAWPYQLTWARSVCRTGETIHYDRGWYRGDRRDGFIRNRLMGNYAQALICIWDGNSRGTKDMYDVACDAGLLVFLWVSP